MNDAPTPRTDAILAKLPGGQTCDPQLVADELRPMIVELERELAEVTAAIHKVHPTRRGSLVDMVEDLDSYRETAMNAFRLSDKELAAERALADRLAETLNDIKGRSCDTTIWLHPDADAKGCVDDCWEWSEQALAAWKASRDQNNLEGHGPTDEERRENARAIQAMTEQERFRLMFHGPSKEQP